MHGEKLVCLRLLRRLRRPADRSIDVGKPAACMVTEIAPTAGLPEGRPAYQSNAVTVHPCFQGPGRPGSFAGGEGGHLPHQGGNTWRGLAGQNKSSSTVSCARKAEGFVKARTQAHTRETSQPAAGGAF